MSADTAATNADGRVFPATLPPLPTSAPASAPESASAPAPATTAATTAQARGTGPGRLTRP